jgi:hypothetical protein
MPASKSKLLIGLWRAGNWLLGFLANVLQVSGSNLAGVITTVLSWLLLLWANFKSLGSISIAVLVVCTALLSVVTGVRYWRSRRSAKSPAAQHLVAIGPDTIAVGEVTGVDGSEWVVHVQEFFRGGRDTLTGFIDAFDRLPQSDRYLLDNEHGDGRQLSAAPSWSKTEGGVVLRCRVAPRFSRIPAQHLGSEWAMSMKTFDMYAEGGQIARHSGVKVLPQRIMSALGMMRGESPMYPYHGSHFAQLYHAYRTAPRLADLLKLEAVRMASIPFPADSAVPEHTPFRCVNRVYSVAPLADGPTDKRLLTRFEFDVEGIGRWTQDLPVFVADGPVQITPMPLVGQLPLNT